MKDIGNFIGIPHHFGMSNFFGADCAGLCILFYNEIFGYTIDDGKPIGTAEEYAKNHSRMLRYLLKTMDKVTSVDDLCFGDIVVTKVFNEHHVALYTEYGRVLTMEIPCVEGKTRSCIYKEIQWKPHFVMGFRRR